MHHLAVAAALLLQLQQAPAAPSSPQAAAQLAQAEARYRSAIAINPRVAAYHQSLARVLERQGRADEALASHRQSVQLDSLSARNRAGYGELLLEMGRAEEAVSHLSAAVNFDPASVDVRKQLAAALIAAKRPLEAAVVLKEARTLAPNDSSIARTLATVTPTETAEGGYHDHSEFESDLRGGWFVRRLLQVIFAVVLGIAAVALVAPIAGTLLLLLRLPFERAR